MPSSGEGRTGRVKTLKKLIIAFLILGILIPILLCILLFIKVENLQRQVNELSTMRQEEKTVPDDVSLAASDVVITSELQFAGQAAAGDAPEAEVQVSVLEQEPEELQESGQEDITKVYLTFDDGPSANTDEILDILKQYDVKATFFVTGKTQEVYEPLYCRIVEEGHTLGMHSFSHRYRDIYASEEMFATDLEHLQEFLYEKTGVWSRFYRFPGGSSNKVSEVPMQQLAEYLTEEDIYYLDWNVSCGDATGRNLRPLQLADNVTENVRKYHTAVVLLHDASDKVSTVEALPVIIEKLQSMEQVEIVPVDDDMTMVQHLQQEEKE